MTEDGLLTKRSTKEEIERRFNNARNVMDDFCRAFYGMTWAEHERLHGERREDGHASKNERTATDTD
jgi:hypothetical protein